MKRLIALGIAMMMIISASLGAVTTVYAAKSINDDTRDIVVVDGGENLPGGEAIIDDNLNYDVISNDDVRDVVEKINGGDKVTPAETADFINQPDNKKNPEQFPTTNGLDVNLKLYDYITQFNNIEVSGTNQDVRIKVPATIGLKPTDIMVMYIDPKTGEISLIIPTEFDPETGEMIVKFPGSGIFALLQKIPIVVRNVHPDEYLNEDVADAVRSLPEDEFLELTDWLKAFNIDGDKLEVADGKKIDISDYNSANYMADIAVQYSLIQYGYNLTTKVNAKLFQQLDDINYERILDYAGVKYDKDAVKEDRSNLEDIEPFVLKDSFIFHVDATTGETSLAYEPEICFKKTKDLTDYEIKIMNEDVHDETVEVPEENKTSDFNLFLEAYAAEADNGTDTEFNDDVLTWNVKDVDNDDDDEMNIVMKHDKYLGMGPFLLLMPKNPVSHFPWWIILVVLAAGGACYFYVKNKKQEDEE